MTQTLVVQANLLNDYLFKFIFGREERKMVTLTLLNAILEKEGREQLSDLTFIDRAQDPLYEADKLSVMDILAETNSGSKINIEVQVANQAYLEKRFLYYWANMYRLYQLRAGETYGALQAGISIIFLNFNLLPQDEYHSIYGIYNLKTGHRLTEDFEMHFLEMAKWPAPTVKEMRRLDRWMGYLSNRLKSEELEEVTKMEPAIREALEAVKAFMSDPQKRREYELREKAIRDHCASLASAREEGREEGREEARREMASRLLALGMPLEKVAQATELPEEEIRKLVN